MTKTLEAAIERLRELPEEQQESLARILLEEIEAHDEWDASTGANPQRVAEISTEVRAAYHRGECEPLDPDKL
ncbi:hypothetical protein MalM25_27210 [Planctomycetes bacterium MalM25]|nr:hypothetical protein MalM25_27210 [Planctomycetes bacterium MalM25]